MHDPVHWSLEVSSDPEGYFFFLFYFCSLDKEKKEDDFEDVQHGLTILVSREDAPILMGTKIDYKQSLMGGGFTIDNPNAIASCGCGTSFKAAKREGTPEVCE